MSDLNIKWPEDEKYKWWAMDKDRTCCFHKSEPYAYIDSDVSHWTAVRGGIEDPNPPDTTGLDWKESLRERPGKKQDGGTVEYKILQEDDPSALQSLVQDYIENGSWRPLGGVAVHVDPVYIGDDQFQYYTHYTQAIFKEDG